MHGNPRFSSLWAIIEGFRGNPVSHIGVLGNPRLWLSITQKLQRPGGQPYRLYFSDPNVQDDYQQSGGKWMRSPVRKVLNMDLLRSEQEGDLYYEMFRLKRPAIKTRVGYGSILFWLDNNGNVMDSHHPNEWVLCTL